jgi:glycosyltransferase involved in cell wall biosynthesis
MKISVIVPAYNEEKTAGRTIESLLNQSFKDYEIIVVNDASTDNTAKVLSKYSNKIKLINKKNNEGRPKALNTGLGMASGDIIATTDADSIAPPDWLQRINEDFKEGIIGLGGSFSAIEEKSYWAVSNCFKDLVFNDFLKKAVTPNMLPGANSAVQASKLREIGGFPLKKWGSDSYLSKKLRGIGELKRDPKLVIKTHYPERFMGSLKRKFFWGVGAVHLVSKNSKKFYLRPLYYTGIIALTLLSLFTSFLAPILFPPFLLLTLLCLAPFTLGMLLVSILYITSSKNFKFLKVLPATLFYPFLLEFSYYIGLIYGLFGGTVGYAKED